MLGRAGKRATIGNFEAATQVLEGADDFGDGGLEDDDLLAAETLEGVEVIDIDNLFEEDGNITKSKRSHTKFADNGRKSKDQLCERTCDEPVRLENGKWACNHTCKKDNKNCKHKCCNEGLDRPRKPPKKRLNQGFEENNNTDNAAPSQKILKIPFEAAQSISRRYQQQKPNAQEAQRLEKLHKATEQSNSSVLFSKEKLGYKQQEKHSDPKQLFAENPCGLSGIYKTEYIDDLELEDLLMPKDLFIDRRGITHVENSLDDGNEIHQDVVGEDLAIDENDSFNLATGMVGLEDSMTLANGNEDFAFETGDIDILGGAHSAFELLANFSSPKLERPVTSEVYDVDNDMGFFETPLTHVEPQSLRKRSTYDNDDFIIGESSSPFKPMPSSDELGQKRTISMTSVCADDQGCNTPRAKRMKSEVETTDVNGPPFIQLRDVTNTYSRLQDLPSTAGEECQSEKEKESYEERQKRLWADIDPAICEELHDIVELVED